MTLDAFSGKLMLEQCECLHCELLVLLAIVLSISQRTGPSERTYSESEKTCKQDTNHRRTKSIESFWFLIIFQLKDGEESFHSVQNVLSQTSE